MLKKTRAFDRLMDQIINREFTYLAVRTKDRIPFIKVGCLWFIYEVRNEPGEKVDLVDTKFTKVNVDRKELLDRGGDWYLRECNDYGKPYPLCILEDWRLIIKVAKTKKVLYDLIEQAEGIKPGEKGNWRDDN